VENVKRLYIGSDEVGVAFCCFLGEWVGVAKKGFDLRRGEKH
jgi:hypothetical protein